MQETIQIIRSNMSSDTDGVEDDASVDFQAQHGNEKIRALTRVLIVDELWVCNRFQFYAQYTPPK